MLLTISIFSRKLLIVNFGEKVKSRIFLEVLAFIFAIVVKIKMKKITIYETNDLFEILYFLSKHVD